MLIVSVVVSQRIQVCFFFVLFFRHAFSIHFFWKKGANIWLTSLLAHIGSIWLLCISTSNSLHRLCNFTPGPLRWIHASTLIFIVSQLVLIVVSLLFKLQSISFWRACRLSVLQTSSIQITCVTAEGAVTATSLVLAALFSGAHLMSTRLAALSLSPLECTKGWRLALPTVFATPVVVALGASLVARFILFHWGFVAAMVYMVPESAPSFWITLLETVVYCFLVYNVVSLVWTVQSAPLRALPAPAVLARALFCSEPSHPLLALPLLRGLHEATHAHPERLFGVGGLLSARIRTAATGAEVTFWSHLLEHSVGLLREKDLMVRLWAKGVAPLPDLAARGGLVMWFVKPYDPVAGLEDLPQLFLWMRTVTTLVTLSLKLDTTGGFTAHRSVETWLEALCSLYAGLQIFLGSRPSSVGGIASAYVVSPDNGRQLMVKAGQEWHGVLSPSYLQSSSQGAVPLRRPLAKEALFGPTLLLDECRVSIYRILVVFSSYIVDLRLDPGVRSMVDLLLQQQQQQPQQQQRGVSE